MLWCLIFHFGELLNYVPALYGIMLALLTSIKKCNKLCAALLELWWQYFTFNYIYAGNLLEFSQFCLTP